MISLTAIALMLLVGWAARCAFRLVVREAGRFVAAMIADPHKAD